MAAELARSRLDERCAQSDPGCRRARAPGECADGALRLADRRRQRYDLAVAGKRVTNATFLDSHAVDIATGSWFAMDLTPLVKDDTLDVATYVTGYIDDFRASVLKQWNVLKRA